MDAKRRIQKSSMVQYEQLLYRTFTADGAGWIMTDEVRKHHFKQSWDIDVAYTKAACTSNERPKAKRSLPKQTAAYHVRPIQKQRLFVSLCEKSIISNGVHVQTSTKTQKPRTDSQVISTYTVVPRRRYNYYKQSALCRLERWLSQTKYILLITSENGGTKGLEERPQSYDWW